MKIISSEKYILDEPVMVRNSDESDSALRRRHFAYVIDGKIATWVDVCASDDVDVWEYCRRPTAEEWASW
jgi:hypothetical protein